MLFGSASRAHGSAPRVPLWRVDEWRCELWNDAHCSHVRLYMGGALVFEREVMGDARRIAAVAHGLETIVTGGMLSQATNRWLGSVMRREWLNQMRSTMAAPALFIS